METSKTKKIVIVTGPKGNQVMKMHKWLNSQNIDHFVLPNKRKIYLKEIELIFTTGVEAIDFKADGCVCLNRKLSDKITNGKNILENIEIEDYILAHENKYLYFDVEKDIKKREGWLYV